ncbi:MAG: hypothetical protein Q7J33_01900 [Serpentinimonas sp.]|nr:hypothetical protein [Serpentinimonas sp.]
MERDTDWPEAEAETYLLPGSEAMLAAALALMTGHAQSACERQRAALAHKIRHLLCALSQQDSLSPSMRAMVRRLHAHWQALPTALAQRVRTPAAGWSGQSLTAVFT